APESWSDSFNALKAYRVVHSAPVDTMGCGWIAEKHLGEKTFRFQTLVALQLSSQTKDEVTSDAVRKLQKETPEGFTVDGIRGMTEAEIDKAICKVGFHNRKAGYMKRTAEICAEKYDGDIPPTLESLMELPGIGPKMAYLAMQCAWNKSVGIGVDTHVHRISNRLGWVKTKEPEQTRKVLPREHWTEINPLMVGFGQTVCLPIKPKCDECPLKEWC
ncbi:DNA glycosylase, partial [Cladochytrium replicatum]